MMRTGEWRKRYHAHRRCTRRHTTPAHHVHHAHHVRKPTSALVSARLSARSRSVSHYPAPSPEALRERLEALAQVHRTTVPLTYAPAIAISDH